MSGHSFLEDKLDPGSVAGDSNRYVLSLIPYEETTTYKKGTAKAPDAVIDASGHIELFDEVLETDASSLGVLTLRPEVTDLASITRAAREAAVAHPDALLGFVGGEHAVTPAIIEGVVDGRSAEGKRPEIGIVWVDAHADLRQEFYGRPDNHACAGFNSLPFGPIVQIGVRTLAEEEWRFLGETDRVSLHTRWAEAARDAILALPDDIYMSIDMDGFAPEVVRAVGTPEPGGLYWQDVMEILEVAFRNKNVLAYDVVELCPGDDDIASTFITARLVYKVMNYHARHRLGHRLRR